MKQIKLLLTAGCIICLSSMIKPETINGASAEDLQSKTDPAWIKLISAGNIIEWRRYIHQNPELSFHEKNTSKYVEDVLRNFGNIEILKPTSTSIIGILHGALSGKTVAFRADLDALPVPEETGLPFNSVAPGVSHACGHDAHTAMLLGTAATLSKMQKEIKGTVYFIFQHAEEQIPGGAKEIIETGMLKGIDAIFGLHVFPNYPAGHIGIFPGGPISTTADIFYLTIHGKGTHGSMPHLGVDPIVTGAEIIIALQTIVSRNVTPGELAVITIGKLQAGTAPNVIPEKAEIVGNVRTMSEETRKLIIERIKTIVNNIAEANNAHCELNYVYGYPSVRNDSTLVGMAKESASKILGSEEVFDAMPMTASEDFTYYKEVAPVCFMMLGTGPGAANHNPEFNIDEKALVNGVKTEVQIILDFLRQK